MKTTRRRPARAKRIPLLLVNPIALAFSVAAKFANGGNVVLVEALE